MAKDANGCTSSTGSITITQNAVVAFTSAKTNVLCYGASTGSITVSATGGTAAYTYSINGGTYQSSNVFSNLAAGTYSIVVKDVNGCVSAAGSVTITQPAAPVTYTTTQVNVLCNGASTGSITVTATGGTGAYTYSINGGTCQASNVFSNLAAGTYTIMAKDANGCTSGTGSVTIIQNAVVAFTSAKTNVNCYGASTGSITVSATGGTAAYTYSINGGTYQSSNVFSNLPAGTYSIVVKDANSCTSDAGSVTITQPAAALSFTTAQTNVTCFGASTGSITVTAAGGTPAYTYSINGGTCQSSNVFSGLAAGTYTIYVKDANGCISASSSVTLTVTDNTPPVVNGCPANITVYTGAGRTTCNQSATWTAPTATDNCTVTTTSNYSSGAVFPVGTTTVTYTFKDASGNTSTCSFTVTVVDNTPPVITCPGAITLACGLPSTPANAGTATGTDNCGGTVAITYTDVVSGNVTTRTWKATDAALNSSTCTQLITSGQPFASTITSVPTSNVYTGVGTPSTTLFIGYGAQSTVLQTNVPTGTYTYAWSGASVSMLSSTTTASPVFTPTHGGSYTFTVTISGALGCSSTASVTICVTDIRVFASVNHNTCSHTSHSSSNCPHQGHNHTCNHSSHSSSDCPDDDHQGTCSHASHSSSNCPHLGHGHTCNHSAHSSSDCPDDDHQGSCSHTSHSASNCPHAGHNHSCNHTSHSLYNCPDKDDEHQNVCTHQAHYSSNCPHAGHNHSCNHSSHSTYNCPDKDDDNDGDRQTMCNHQSHSSYDCPHKGHNHYCDHRSHSTYNCAHRNTNDRDDDDEKDCDHKAHSSSDCSHKGHNHASCNHQAHSSSNCPHNKNNTTQQTVCNHQSHSSSDCNHEGHNHGSCNHRSHTASECPHNGGTGGTDDDEDDKKVYICHVPPGNPGMHITLSISVNAVAAHLTNHPGDRLGSCDQAPCTGYTDVEKPVIDCSDNITVAYGSSTAPVVTGSPEADDNSGDVNITYTDVSTKGTNPAAANYYNYTITRTWKATDLAGNYTTCAQIITVTETVKPVISCPGNVTAACGSTATGTATATDNASAVTITYTDVVSGYTTTRTWKATDVAGNYATCTQTITVIDNVKPVINCPGDVIVSCNGSSAPAATGTASASDNCSVPVVTYNDVTNGNIISRTWKATDAAGNFSTCVQTITLPVTTISPNQICFISPTNGDVVNAKSTWTVNSTAQTVTIRTSFAKTFVDNTYGTNAIGWGTRGHTFSDLTGSDKLQLALFDKTGTKKLEFVMDYLTASSAAPSGYKSLGVTGGEGSMVLGSSSSIVKVVTSMDENLNTFGYNLITNSPATNSSYAANSSYSNWIYDVWYEVTVSLSAFGTSGFGKPGVVSVHASPSKTGNNTEPVVETSCGTVASVMNTPADITVNCGSSLDPSVTGRATAINTCAVISITYSDVTNGNVITRTWKATDGLGNFTTDTQEITIVDNVKPVITDVADKTVNCGSSTLPAATGTATATDNCSTPTVTFNDATSGNVITRTWKATDAAGNYSTSIQTITIVDNVKPTITVPANITVSCGASTAPSYCGGSATGTDACSSVTITYTDATSGNVITRTWKATDAAGNFITGTQTITIVDNVKPVISDVSDITISCGASTTPSGCGSVATATDNCSTPVVTYSDVTAGNKITRTWKAVDAAGNIATSTQIITIVDNTKPVLVEPADITVSCGSSTLPATTGNASATDNCSAVTISYTDARSGNKITRTWKATDAAGNYDTDVQVITISDAIKPVITDVADKTLNCGGSTLPANTGTPTATDNCSTPTVTYNDVTSGNVITRTWKATDAAGNYSTSVQTITIGSSFTAALTSVPSSSTYTGGVATNLYLGYGAQTTTLQMCSLPTAGAPYTYVWSGSYTSKLNSTTSASPLFTPTTFGYYTFNVTVTNKFGCTSTASISICVTDIRVAGTSGSGAKVYMCHTPSGYNKTPQTLQVLVSQVPSHLSPSTCGGDGNDRLGSCGQTPCNTTSVSSIVSNNTMNATKEGVEKVATSEEELKVTVMPNPSTTFFTLKLESKYETPVTLRVMDGRGRVVDAKSKIGANSTFQIGHNYSSGTYYAELIQGGQRKVVQLIKGRG